MLARKLLYPLVYFRMRNGEKTILDFIVTPVLAALMWLPFFLVQDSNFFGQDGFLARATGVISALAGFYVAALIIAATFELKDLDQPISQGAVKLSVSKDEDITGFVAVSRRELMSAIFGYLSFMSLTISFISILTTSLIPQASAANPPVAVDSFEYYGRLLGIGTFLLPISSLISVSLLGFYYLMDRMFHKEPKIISPALELVDKEFEPVERMGAGS